MRNMFLYMSVSVIELLFISIKMLSDLRKFFLMILYLSLSLNRSICRIHDRDPRYYADGEDAFSMRRELVPSNKVQVPTKS